MFSPVKSAVLLWALDERPWVRAGVRQAHEDAKNAALGLLEEHAAFTRTGTGGIAQIDTKGLIAAAFEHWDSRDGDPNLHTHVAISSKVQGIDGKWRALDARALYRITVAASECYNTAFETALTQRLGVEFVPRPDTSGNPEPVREVSGVPFGMIGHFSARRARIEARYAAGCGPTAASTATIRPARACHQLARRPTSTPAQAKKLAAVFEADPDLSAAGSSMGKQQSARCAAIDSSFWVYSGPAALPRMEMVPSCPASPPSTSFSSTGAWHPDARSSNCASCSAWTDRPAVRGGTDRLS